MKKRLRVTLITLLPLVLFVNLLPWARVINVNLLLGLQFALLGFIPWKYRNELTQWSATKAPDDPDRWKRGHYVRLLLGTIACFGLSVFFLVHYLLELLK